MLLAALLLAAVPQAPADGSFLDPLLRFERTGQPAAPRAVHVNHGTSRAAGEELLAVPGDGLLTRVWLPVAGPGVEILLGGGEEADLVLDAETVARMAAFAGPLVRVEGGALDFQVPVPFTGGLRVRALAAGQDFRVEARAAGETPLPEVDADFWEAQRENYQLVGDLLTSGEFLLQPRERASSFGRIKTNTRLTGQIRRSGVIHAFRLEILNADELDLAELFRGVRLRIRTDKQLLVDVPLGAWFLADTGQPAGRAHLLRSTYDSRDGLKLDSFLPIPFADGAQVVLLNETSEIPLCRLHLYFSSGEAPDWRLHAAWTLNEGVSGSYPALLLDADGPGELLGAAVSVRSESLTGSVDPSGFFGLPPGPLEPFRTPLQGVGRAQGWTFLDRLMPASPVPLGEALRFELPLELGPESTDVATMAWWYAPVSAEHRLGPTPDALARQPR